jgi:hypothetical protein
LASNIDGHREEYLEECAINQEVNEAGTNHIGIAPHAIDMKAAECLWTLSEQRIATKLNYSWKSAVHGN